MTKLRVISAVVVLGLALGCETKGANQATTAQLPTAEMPALATPAHEDNARLPGTAAASLTLVTDRSLVCMVNNRFMGRPQIPIQVEGRTCCEMCKGRLGSDPSSRVSTDPVSGSTVDKATAVIGRSSDGRTLYFESEQTFAAYARGAVR